MAPVQRLILPGWPLAVHCHQYRPQIHFGLYDGRARCFPNGVMVKCFFGGSPLSLLEERKEEYKFDKEEMKEKAIDGGWITYDGKCCTEYGICTTLARLVRAVYDDEKCIIPVSAQLDDEYGQTDIYAGVPCVIGKHGAEQILELPLTNNEIAEFTRCCADIREYMRKI